MIILWFVGKWKLVFGFTTITTFSDLEFKNEIFILTENNPNRVEYTFHFLNTKMFFINYENSIYLFHAILRF